MEDKIPVFESFILDQLKDESDSANSYCLLNLNQLKLSLFSNKRDKDKALDAVEKIKHLAIHHRINDLRKMFILKTSLFKISKLFPEAIDKKEILEFGNAFIKLVEQMETPDQEFQIHYLKTQRIRMLMNLYND